MLKIDNNTVRGPSFTVRTLSIHWVEYSESGRVAKIEIEGPAPWSVYRQSLMDWEPPDQADDMDRAKRDEIVDRVSACLVVLGMPNRID